MRGLASEFNNTFSIKIDLISEGLLEKQINSN